MKDFKTNFMTITIISTIIMLSFIYQGCMKWDKDKVVNGIEFSKIRYETINDDTVTIIGYLKKNMNIEGYSCDEDWVHFTKGWQIKLFKLSEDCTINNFKYSKGTWIKFDKEHNVICVFPGNTPVQGYLCKGDGSVKGISTSFYKSGRLRSFFSDEEVKVGETYCLGGVLNNIELYENGALKECTLSRAREINGVKYDKNTRISLDEKGNLSRLE